MTLVRRELLQLAGAAIAASAAAQVASAQVPAVGPKLTQIMRKDLQGQGGVLQESVISVVEFGPGSAAPWHMHPGAQEILYTLDGSLIVEIEGEGTSTVKAGDCSIIPADLPHLARNESTSTTAKALVVHSRGDKDKPLVVAVKR